MRLGRGDQSYPASHIGSCFTLWLTNVSSEAAEGILLCMSCTIPLARWLVDACHGFKSSRGDFSMPNKFRLCLSLVGELIQIRSRHSLAAARLVIFKRNANFYPSLFSNIIGLSSLSSSSFPLPLRPSTSSILNSHTVTCQSM